MPLMRLAMHTHGPRIVWHYPGTERPDQGGDQPGRQSAVSLHIPHNKPHGAWGAGKVP